MLDAVIYHRTPHTMTHPPPCRPYGTWEDGLLTTPGYKHVAPMELGRKLFDLLKVPKVEISSNYQS